MSTLFRRITQLPQFRTNKMINKRSVDYHPSSSGLLPRIHPFFLWTPKGFVFLWNNCQIFSGSWKFSGCLTVVGENIQIYSGKITGKCVCESKNWIYKFLNMPYPRQNSLPGSHHHLFQRWITEKLLTSPRQPFFESLPVTEREGENYEDYQMIEAWQYFKH